MQSDHQSHVSKSLLVKLAPTGIHGIIILVVKHSPVAKVMSAFRVLYQCSLLVAHSSHGLSLIPLF